MKIEILGTGCAKCKKLEKNVKRAVKELKVKAEVDKVESLEEIMNRGLMMTPVLVINGETKVSGKVPTVDQIKGFLKQTK